VSFFTHKILTISDGNCSFLDMQSLARVVGRILLMGVAATMGGCPPRELSGYAMLTAPADELPLGSVYRSPDLNRRKNALFRADLLITRSRPPSLQNTTDPWDRDAPWVNVVLPQVESLDVRGLAAGATFNGVGKAELVSVSVKSVGIDVAGASERTLDAGDWLNVQKLARSTLAPSDNNATNDPSRWKDHWVITGVLKAQTFTYKFLDQEGNVIVGGFDAKKVDAGGMVATTKQKLENIKGSAKIIGYRMIQLKPSPFNPNILELSGRTYP
jgi:hypothetical protein